MHSQQGLGKVLQKMYLWNNKALQIKLWSYWTTTQSFHKLWQVGNAKKTMLWQNEGKKTT